MTRSFQVRIDHQRSYYLVMLYEQIMSFGSDLVGTLGSVLSRFGTTICVVIIVKSARSAHLHVCKLGYRLVRSYGGRCWSVGEWFVRFRLWVLYFHLEPVFSGFQSFGVVESEIIGYFFKRLDLDYHLREWSAVRSDGILNGNTPFENRQLEENLSLTKLGFKERGFQHRQLSTLCNYRHLR